MKRLTRSGSHFRGQAMAEFALVLPLFVLMLFGIIDLSRFVYSNNSLSEVARESARQGSVAYRPADCNGLSRVACIQTLAKNRLTAVAIDVGDVVVTCQRLTNTNAFIPCPAAWRADDVVKVTISRELDLLTPVISQLIGPATMTGAAQVTVSG